MAVGSCRPRGPRLSEHKRYPPASSILRKSHLDAIHGAYANAPYYEMIREELLNPIYAFPTDFLCEFSIHAIRICCDYLGLHPEFHLSSELHIPKTDNASRWRVLDICLHFNATEYISGLGGLRYLDHDLFDKQHIQVKYMQYDNTLQPVTWRVQSLCVRR